MKQYRLCFLGFGNVGRALARLFVSKSAELRDNYGIEWEITGVATRRMGWRASDEAIDVAQLLAGNDETNRKRASMNGWREQALMWCLKRLLSIPKQASPRSIILKIAASRRTHDHRKQGADRLRVRRAQRDRDRARQTIYV